MKHSICAILLAFAIGCTTAPTAITTQSAEWNHDFDVAWAAVSACWKADPSSMPKPQVTVRPERHDFTDPWGRVVHGYFEAPDSIVVAGNLGALKHELSEYICYAITGDYCKNARNGCFDVGVL